MEEDAAAAGNDSLAPYLHIADVLRREILDGLYQVGERMPSQAELEDRFEVSRPTVQRALTELRKTGLIDNQRGRSAEVQPWHGGVGGAVGGGEPEPAYASLGAHVATAFEQPHITVDAFSLTTETLLTALTAQLQRIQRNEVHPASIKVRVLLPSQDAQLAIPKLVADPADDRPLRRLRQLVRGHVISLRSAFTALTDVHPDIRHDIEFRTVALTPTSKVYVLNGRTALFGYYQVVERPVLFGNGDRAPIFDVLGVNAILFAHHAGEPGAGSGEQRFVAETQSWFDSLWQSVAQPLRLFE